LAETQAAEPLIERLDPPRRAAVVMALLGITILGLFLVTLILLGGSWTRRMARKRLGPSDDQTNIENQRLRSTLEPILPASPSGETTISRKRSDDTIIDS
jgi:hypothetical protein